MLEGFTWYKQSAYRWKGEGLTIYIDPWGVTPEDGPADVIFITHAHFDHYQPEEIAKVRTGKTKIVAPRDIARELGGEVKAVSPGDAFEVGGIRGQAVPAYNTNEARLQAHPKANAWVGYLLELGGRHYYHAGDTDHVPELERIKTDVAFVPIGGTYTMEAPEAAALVKAMKPRLAVPMHYGFVVGTLQDAVRFAREAKPVEVQTLTPVHAFEKSGARA
ncbi:MAG TPA: MBL fold metallo-hydrolase [Candidatus Limnocylindrales bacterium]|nr:MBL fold metallo-hydrolase [Candidatus Limnocylindrales bacterium]